ncbi:unnamed protein product [Meloidogyne enterolobii]|uniref:Uncharacterized protein n=1 Tax=Meloidogyne enterolobii TaxID=390850 RepID=A0ACB0Z0R5_MELEN
MSRRATIKPPERGESTATSESSIPKLRSLAIVAPTLHKPFSNCSYYPDRDRRSPIRHRRHRRTPGRTIHHRRRTPRSPVPANKHHRQKSPKPPPPPSKPPSPLPPPPPPPELPPIKSPIKIDAELWTTIPEKTRAIIKQLEKNLQQVNANMIGLVAINTLEGLASNPTAQQYLEQLVQKISALHPTTKQLEEFLPHQKDDGNTTKLFREAFGMNLKLKSAGGGNVEKTTKKGEK